MLTLTYRDSRPIYEQIKDGLRRMIVTGAMAQDEKLPSVRALATQLSINPNTIQRAYNELEAEGYIYSVAGKGSFVSGTADADAVRRETLRADVKKLLNELRYLGVTEADAAALIKEVRSGMKSCGKCLSWTKSGLSGGFPRVCRSRRPSGWLCPPCRII